jgi:LEA14-like dessication related protein
MKFFLIISLIIVSFTGCLDFKNPTLGEVSNFKMDSFSDNVVKCNFEIKVDNPNTFNIKLKRSTIDVLVDDVLYGKINLDKKIKFRKKSDKIYTVPLILKLEKGAMIKLMGLMLKSKVNLRLKGRVKGSVYGITKRKDIDIFKEIDPREMKSLFQKN